MTDTSKEIERLKLLDEFKWDLKELLNGFLEDRELIKQLVEKKQELTADKKELEKELEDKDEDDTN